MDEKMWFITGNNPELSAAEIAAVLNLKPDGFSFIPPIFIADKASETAHELISRLGGTVKIAIPVGQAASEMDLISFLVKALKAKSGKIVFGLNYYSDEPEKTRTGKVEIWGKNIKKNLKEDGLSVRYIFKNTAVISSATAEHNDLTKKGADIIIFKQNNSYYIGQTVVVQPFEEWGRRDFGRPSRDDVSGMLPPKIARIMINLAGKKPENTTILDPFCGSGTIASEAAILGYKKIIGFDISDKAIKATRDNLEWLKKSHEILSNDILISTGDVQDLSKKIKQTDIIVTEPYLGPPRRGTESENELKKTMAELKSLYLKAVEQFTKILSSDGAIIMIIPCYKYKDKWLNIDLSGELNKLHLQAAPLLKTKSRVYDFLLYARPNQRIGRQIWKFTKISS